MEQLKLQPDCLQVNFKTVREMEKLGFGTPITTVGELLIYPMKFEKQFKQLKIKFDKRNLSLIYQAKRMRIGSLLARR